jgi:hypothetical protein
MRAQPRFPPCALSNSSLQGFLVVRPSFFVYTIFDFRLTNRRVLCFLVFMPQAKRASRERSSRSSSAAILSPRSACLQPQTSNREAHASNLRPPTGQPWPAPCALCLAPRFHASRTVLSPVEGRTVNGKRATTAIVIFHEQFGRVYFWVLAASIEAVRRN